MSDMDMVKSKNKFDVLTVEQPVTAGDSTADRIVHGSENHVRNVLHNKSKAPPVNIPGNQRGHSAGRKEAEIDFLKKQIRKYEERSEIQRWKRSQSRSRSRLFTPIASIPDQFTKGNNMDKKGNRYPP
jgi:hypothetical protein